LNVVLWWWERGGSVVKRGDWDACFWKMKIAPTFKDFSVENI